MVSSATGPNIYILHITCGMTRAHHPPGQGFHNQNTVNLKTSNGVSISGIDQKTSTAGKLEFENSDYGNFDYGILTLKFLTKSDYRNSDIGSFDFRILTLDNLTFKL